MNVIKKRAEMDHTTKTNTQNDASQTNWYGSLQDITQLIHLSYEYKGLNKAVLLVWICTTLLEAT